MRQSESTAPSLELFPPPLSRRRRLASALAWYTGPAIVVCLVVAYIAGAVVWHANPPAVPVQGVSMRPTLHAGDLVLLRGADPARLRIGDIIAVHVPGDQRSKYSLPSDIVHRIVKIGHDAGGRYFVTKGDANAGVDAFQSHGNDVIGVEAARIPGAGYPLLFFHSRAGKFFAGACILVGLLYFLLGVVEERRAYVQGTALTMQVVLDETQELKEVITSAQARPSWTRDEILDELRSVRATSDDTAVTMRELVGAIREYGEHLRSHTAVMRNLASSTNELKLAAAAITSAIDGGIPPHHPRPHVASRDPDQAPLPGSAASPSISPYLPPDLSAAGPTDDVRRARDATAALERMLAERRWPSS